MMKMLGAAVAAVVLSCAGAAGAATTINEYASGTGDDALLAFACGSCVRGEALAFEGDALTGATRISLYQSTFGLTVTSLQIANATPNTIVRFRNIFNEPGLVLGVTDGDGQFSLSAPWLITEHYGFLTVGNKPFDVATMTAQGEALVSMVPEPSTWAMMILGFGMVGTAVRHRRPLGSERNGAARI